MSTAKQDYTKITVKSIKERLSNIGYKAPSDFRKGDLVKYLEGAIYAHAHGIPPTNPNRDKKITFSAKIADPKLTYLEHLHTHGWAITKVLNFDPEVPKKGILSWLTRSCGRFNPNDQNTWLRKNIPYRDRGMFRRQLSHSDFLWYTRIACKPIFKEIWQTDDLLTSFDGCAFQVASKVTTSFTTKHWMHCDQGREITHFACVQGIVNLYDNGALDGGTILMNQSQTKFMEYLSRHPVDGLGRLFPVDPFDPILSSCEIVKPCLKAGEILLFDSRMFHCNTDPQGTVPRSCVYVSMMPKKYCSENDLKDRKDFFEKGIGTNHWAYGPEFHKITSTINPMYTKGLPEGEKEKRCTPTQEILSLAGY